MVTKNEESANGERVKVEELKLDKETLKDLSDSEAKEIKGGTDTVVGCVAITVGVTVGVSLAICKKTG